MKLYAIFKEFLLHYLTVFLLSILISFLSVLSAKYLGDLTASFTNADISQNYSLIVCFVIFCVLQITVQCFLTSLVKTWIGNTVFKETEVNLFRKIMSIPYDDPHLSNQKDLYSLIQNDTAAKQTYCSETLVSVIFESVRLFISVVYIAYRSSSLALLYFVFVCFSVYLQFIFGDVINEKNALAKESEINLNTTISDIINNRVISETYHIDDYIDELLKCSQEEYTQSKMAVAKVSLPLKMIGVFCGMMPILAICLAGIYMLTNRLIDASVFLSVFYICQNIMPSQLHYADLIEEVMKMLTSVLRIDVFMAENESKPNDEHISEDCIIQADSVCYRYPNTPENSVSNISLTIRNREKVAVIGDSGSGKSTLLLLLSGLIRPDSGSVCIRRKDSVMVNQFPYIFNGTLYNNIVFDHDRQKEKQFASACADACLDSFVQYMPDSYNTELKNNGNNLSGGQRQRIAIARALYTNKNIILFDEPISALDGDTSNQIISNILSKKDKTIIMSIHQNEYLPLFDRILLLSSGELVFDGKPDEYLKVIEYEK